MKRSILLWIVGLILYLPFSTLAQDTTPDYWENNGSSITTPPTFNGTVFLNTTNPNKLGLYLFPLTNVIKSFYG